MIHWNPIPHVKNAWAGCHTAYGKAGLVVFYALIWFNIASSIWTLVDPSSQGMDCLINSFKGAEAQHLYAATLRALSVTTIGFLLYADVGGLRSKNVALVTVVLVADYAIGITSTKNLECAAFHWFSLTVIVWPLLAWALVYLEERLGGGSTASGGERTPLNV
jgi:hypothetical protein